MSPPDVAVSRHASKSSEARAGRLDAITNPGAVKINVQGAFIVDEEPQSRSKSPVEADGVHYESKDIRLPHHTGIVSHVAVDVSLPWPPPRAGIRAQVDAHTHIQRERTDCCDDRLAGRWRNWSILPASWTLRIMVAG